MENKQILPVPPPSRPALQSSKFESWAKKRRVKTALTIIVSLYLIAQLLGMIGMFFVMILGWGFDDKLSPFWTPLYLIQAFLMGYILWFLWRKPKGEKPDPFAIY